jgi:hypothetical protein
VGTLPRIRVFLVLLMVVAGLIGGNQIASAGPIVAGQDSTLAQTEEGFSLPAFTTFCEPGSMGPFAGCTPWEGVTVGFVTSDGAVNTTCVTAGTERAASCSVVLPFGSTVTVSIDPATVPAGYALQNPAVQEIPVPDAPPDGVFGGANFVLLPTEAEADIVSMPVYASLCSDGFEPHDDCLPWEGALVTVMSAADDSYIGECTTATFFETVAGCEVAVERGTSVVATISLDTLPVDYQLTTVQIVYDVPVTGEVSGPMFLAIPAESQGDLSPLPVYASICDDELPPNDDCQPWEGVVISAETADGAFYNECVAGTFFETVAGCEIMMPRGANVTAYVTEGQIPEGYELFVEVPTWDIPAEGDLESGPYFFLVPVDGQEPALTPTPGPVTRLPSTGSGIPETTGIAWGLVAASAVLMLGGVSLTLRRR